MKTKFTTIALIISLVTPILLIDGCTKRYGNIKLEGLTMETISQKIVRGQSSKDNVLKEYGKPQAISRSAGGKESWHYEFVISDYLTPRGSAFIKKFDVTFDPSGRVIDYSLQDKRQDW